MAKLKWVSIVLSLCVGLAVAQEENCDTEKWLPEGQGTSHEGCVEYDGSLVPDCGEFLQNNVTAYFHVHEYSKIDYLIVLVLYHYFKTVVASGSAVLREPV